MPVTDTPVFVQALGLGLVQIANADASGLKTVVTAGANGSKISALLFASDDTTARDIQWGVERGGTFYPVATVTVAIGAGTTAAAAAVDAFSTANCPGLPTDANGQPYLHLISGDTLKIKSLTTVTSAKLVSAKAVYGDL